MKKIILWLLSCSLAIAKPDITWDDPNPVSANIVSYIVYEQIVSTTGTTYKAIWKVTGSKVFNLPAAKTTKIYTVSAVNSYGIEGPMSEPLIISAPMALRNLRVQ